MRPVRLAGARAGCDTTPIATDPCRPTGPPAGAGTVRRPEGRAGAVLAGLIAAAVSAFVFRRVVGAYFWADDFGWLYLIHDRSPVEVLLTPLGGHALVVRNAIFLAVHALAGLDPRPYFWTALATHVVNVVLIARLVWLLTGRSALAGLGAVAYGTCPATAETLGWYSAYGQVAATTCVLEIGRAHV